MNTVRPVNPGVFVFGLAWFAIAVVVAVCLIYLAASGQALVRKLLFTIGGLCLLTVPAFVVLKFSLISWYGGMPDLAASRDGQFYVRSKQMLTPVSADEFHWLQRMHQNEHWFVRPCVVGFICIGLACVRRPQPLRKGEQPEMI